MAAGLIWSAMPSGMSDLSAAAICSMSRRRITSSTPFSRRNVMLLADSETSTPGWTIPSLVTTVYERNPAVTRALGWSTFVMIASSERLIVLDSGGPTSWPIASSSLPAR